MLALWGTVKLLALACALWSCVGPAGRIGFDREVVKTLAEDQAAWCITVDFAQVFLFLQIVRVSYWRDNAVERQETTLRDCSSIPLLRGTR